jgi:hypothetical protein
MSDQLKEAFEAVDVLEEEEKLAVIRRLVKDDELFEDLSDAMSIASQRKEPTRDYRQFIGELSKEGRQV